MYAAMVKMFFRAKDLRRGLSSEVRVFVNRVCDADNSIKISGPYSTSHCSNRGPGHWVGDVLGYRKTVKAALMPV